MMQKDTGNRVTLSRFLAQRQQMYPQASGELTQVIVQLSTVAKIIGSYARRAALLGIKGLTGETNVQGEEVEKLDRLSNDAFMEAFEYVDIVGAIVSEEMAEPLILHAEDNQKKYVVLVDPLDGSSNLEVDCITGSIFSIRTFTGGDREDILHEGSKQIGAGYIMYGASILLVYTSGDGVHSFVLDEAIGEFVLDHEDIRMPDRGKIISANFGNYHRWSGPVRVFSDSLINKGGQAYSLRYSGALVADLHQILHRGGIYFYPEDDKRSSGKLRLLYECAPLAMIAEQAGGGATSGRRRIMEILPDSIHQRVPFAIGSLKEIEAYERNYAEHSAG
ncbi:MAG: class 1 fructose-bisphosphatase [Desulforhopalus sp.]